MAKDTNKLKVIIIVLSLSLISVFIFYYITNRNLKNYFGKEIDSLILQKDSLQSQYIKLTNIADSVLNVNTDLEKSISNNKIEINSLKSKISKILQKNQLTLTELENARNLIKSLNGKLDELTQELINLREENQRLNLQNKDLEERNANLNAENQGIQNKLIITEKEKAEIADIASTMRASSFKLLSFRQTKKGSIKATTSHIKAKFFQIEFNIEDNPLASSGSKEIYVIISDPTGKIIANDNNLSFKTRNEGEKLFTDKIVISFEKGKTNSIKYSKHIPAGIIQGTYSISVYNNGFKIGEAQTLLN